VTGDTTPWFSGSLLADLERLLGQRVQAVIRRSLSPPIRDAVLREAVPLRNLERAYVEHVIERIRRIAEDSAPGRDAVFASRTLQDAIVRNPQVLCESTQRVGEPHKRLHPEINWSSVAGMRNVLVHDTFGVDFETLWLAEWGLILSCLH
jgi:uncharacterized protein with HEPN domain